MVLREAEASFVTWGENLDRSLSAQLLSMLDPAEEISLLASPDHKGLDEKSVKAERPTWPLIGQSTDHPALSRLPLPS